MEMARRIEHTLLRATTTSRDIVALCAEAMARGFYSVCVPPCHVTVAEVALKGTGVRITTVAGFPLGGTVSEAKAQEAMLAVSSGAHEVDMVMPVGAALEGRWDMVESDISTVRMTVPTSVLKVIIEMCYLDDDQKRRAVEAVVSAGADYVKTSTGFGPGGANVEDVWLIKIASRGRIKIKASGGIKTYEQALNLIEAGADLIGTSSGPAIMDSLL